MERVKRNNWFDEECEQVTINYTRGAVEEYREARREEKRVH
jgi:hypothetical protein